MKKKVKIRIPLIVVLFVFLILTTNCKKNPDDPKLPEVATSEVTLITTSTIQCGGNITNDNGYIITKRGVCYSKKSEPNINDSITNDGSGANSFISKITGLTPGTTYFIRAYASNNMGTSYGSIVSFTTVPTTIKDIENNTYKVVQIGTQVWMAENLKTTKYKTGEDIPLVTNNVLWINLNSPAYCWCYNDEQTYKNKYGALYNWYTVNTNKICPTNWHVPSYSEWTTLFNYLGGAKIAGNKLKSTTGWTDTNSDVTNESGFTALPGGYRNTINGLDGVVLVDGFWWSSTENNNNTVFFPYLDYAISEVVYNNGDKKNGCSIRCIQD